MLCQTSVLKNSFRDLRVDKTKIDSSRNLDAYLDLYKNKNVCVLLFHVKRIAGFIILVMDIKSSVICYQKSRRKLKFIAEKQHVLKFAIEQIDCIFAIA